MTWTLDTSSDITWRERFAGASSGPRWQILNALADDEQGWRALDAAVANKSARASVTKPLAELVDLGLVETRGAGRSQRWHVTPIGRAIVQVLRSGPLEPAALAWILRVKGRGAVDEVIRAHRASTRVLRTAGDDDFILLISELDEGHDVITDLRGRARKAGFEFRASYVLNEWAPCGH
jgi:DNA-binding MarR family transcriptional regulator